MLRQNWMAASENVGWRPRLPVGGANHCMSLSSQTVNAPLALRALLYSRQFVVLYRRLSGLSPSSALISRAHYSPPHPFVQQSLQEVPFDSPEMI